MKPFHRRGIKLHLLAYSIGVTLGMTLLVASFSYSVFNRLLTESLRQSTSINLHLVSETISKDLLPILSLSNWCTNNAPLSTYLELASETETYRQDYMNHHSEITKNLYDASKDALRIESLTSWKRLLEEYRNNRSGLYITRIVIGSFSDHYLQIAPVSSYHALNVPSTIQSFDFFDRIHTQHSFTWLPIMISPFSDADDFQILPILQPVNNYYNNNTIGWSYISVSADIITDAFNNYDYPRDSDLYIQIQEQVYQLANGKLHPISSSITEQLNANNQLVSINSSLGGWKFYQTLSQSQFRNQRHVYYSLLLVIILLIFLLGLTLTYWLHKRINQPIGIILNRMDAISAGDFEPDPHIEWPNEFGDIGRGINQMTTDIHQLMTRRLQDEQEKNQLEYQVLQNQINPHFLYNTLNSIKWMATLQNATGIAEMTTSLSKLLRYISKGKKTIHTLSEELDLLQHYFTIQKFRYGGNLFLDIHIDPFVNTNCLIPIFSLQPIVENAIFHGIEPKGAVGHIRITITINAEESIEIDICDDGIGMSDDVARNLLTQNEHNDTDFFKNIGIVNVHKRIQHTFGSQYGLYVKSTSSQGTTITIVIPQRS